MWRREFIALLGGAAAWPLAAVPQQPAPERRIGVLVPYASDAPDSNARLAAFREELERRGWSEGRNVRIDYRFTTDSNLYLPLARELVALQPDVILAVSVFVAE